MLLSSHPSVAAAIHFQTAISELRKAGVNKIFVTELHGLEYNLDLVGNVAQGARRGGGAVCLWRELPIFMNIDDFWWYQAFAHRYAKQNLTGTERAQFADYVAESFICAEHADVAARSRARDANFHQLMIDQQLAFEGLDFYNNMTNRDLARSSTVRRCWFCIACKPSSCVNRLRSVTNKACWITTSRRALSF